MILGRWLGWLLVIAAVVIAAGDAAATWHAGSLTLTSLDALWHRLDPASLARLPSALTEGHSLAATTLTAIARAVLSWPAVVDLGVPGLALLYLCRRRQRRRRFSGR